MSFWDSQCRIQEIAEQNGEREASSTLLKVVAEPFGLRYRRRYTCKTDSLENVTFSLGHLVARGVVRMRTTADTH